MKIDYIGKIKKITSDIIGENPSIYAEVMKEDCVGVRTVNIIIYHEAKPFKKGEVENRIIDEIVEMSEIVIDGMTKEGYSITDTQNINSEINENYARIILRSSLTPIFLEKEEKNIEDIENIANRDNLLSL